MVWGYYIIHPKIVSVMFAHFSAVSNQVICSSVLYHLLMLNAGVWALVTGK
jgi:hypothetical protein